MQVRGRRRVEPMVRATDVELSTVWSRGRLAGSGRCRRRDDGGRYDAYLHCDVLVIGGGPAGLAAAPPRPRRRAGAAGRPRLEAVPVDRRTPPRLPDDAALGRADDDRARPLRPRLRGRRAARVHPGAPRAGLWRIRAGRIVLATGAHERPVAFAGNDRPGVMLAGAAARLRRAVRRRARPTAPSSSRHNDTTDAGRRDLPAAGVEIAAVVDAGAGRASVGRRRAARTTSGAVGGGSVAPASTARRGIRAADHGVDGRVEADLLAVSGGWNPTSHLWSHAARHAPLRRGASPAFVRTPPGRTAASRPSAPPPAPSSGLGEVTPRGSPRRARDGRLRPRRRRATTAARHFVDLAAATPPSPTCAARSTPACARRARQALHDRSAPARPGQDLGRVTAACCRAARRRTSAQLGIDRPSARRTTPVSLRAARRPRPRRTCRPGPDHADPRLARRHGAVFEDVGQWKRPWYYPARRRDDGRGGPARVPGGARRGRGDGRLDARQDRHAGPRRGRVPRPRLHQHVLHAAVGLLPLRR